MENKPTQCKKLETELTFRKMGGFLNTPTPGGVPVRNTSPGYRVTNLPSRQMNKAVQKTLGMQ